MSAQNSTLLTPQLLAQVVDHFDPAAKLLSSWPLQGGISAQMTALEIARGDGTVERIILRQPGSAHATKARDEFRILQVVQAIGVNAQRPYQLDESGTILPHPYLLIEYIEGAPDYAPSNPIRYAEQVATQLATLHRMDITTRNTSFDLSFLPQQAPRLDALIQQPPATLDDALMEGIIRNVLAAAWPLACPLSMAAPVLLHGDFWPGNLLWRDGELVAIIDWEDAEMGNPLADFAITRLDLLWMLGPDAMHAFSARYQQLTPFDFRDQPYWDLVASLRPASRLDEWAAGWPQLGRPDMTVASMTAGHRWFVQAALAQIGEG